MTVVGAVYAAKYNITGFGAKAHLTGLDNLTWEELIYSLADNLHVQP